MKTLYEQIGGLETCQQLSNLFHEKIEKELLLRPVFPKDLTQLSEWLALFVAERFEGPKAYSAERGKQSLLCRHAHLSISTEEAERWLVHMFAAIDEVGIGDPALKQLREFFTETAQSLTDPYLPLYRVPLDELRTKLEADPRLLSPSPMGHSLLRNAVCEWDAQKVRLLLEFGADASSEEPRGHGLLYRAANARLAGSETQGQEVAELLIRYGAVVDLPSGPGKSTPLHVASRRGHVFLADLFLKVGADIESKDSKGESPLRRAVNCQRPLMVQFLLSKGANALSEDKHGRTSLDAARSDALRAALERPIEPR